MRRVVLGLLALALSLAAPALAGGQSVAYYPKLPCTAFNLSKRIPTNTALDSAALAVKCAQVKQHYVDSVLAARAARTASATSTAAARADSIARAAWVADSLRGAAVANPYPGYGLRNLVRPATFTATSRAKYLRDSLALEYPVDGIGRPCWKYAEPEAVHYEKRYRCFREHELEGYGVLGTLHTYFRGRWQNLVTLYSGDTKRAVLRDTTGAPMRAITISAP